MSAARLVRTSVAVALAFVAAGAALAAGGELKGRAEAPRVLHLTVNDAITGGTAEYVEAGLARARAERLDAVAITLDTPGGILDATRDIVQKMLASEVPVVVWVGPAGARAGSAGVFLT